MNSNYRKDFPVLRRKINGNPLVYLDTAATAQTPTRVIKAMTQFYTHDYATVHRGVYELSQKATDKCESVRKKVQHFLCARKPEEIVFTKGTTDAINLVANGAAETWLAPGKEVLISETEHHANIVPWQRACDRSGATLKVIPIKDSGELDRDAFQKLLSERTAFLAVAHISNALGVCHPIQEMIQKAHEVGAKVLIDGAQAVGHQRVDVTALDCDFYAFSGHKLYGPTGIGVLYGKYQALSELPPYQTGGDMIDEVFFEKTTFAQPPLKFEAGTPAFVEIIGLGEAIDYLLEIGFSEIEKNEQELLVYLQENLQKLPWIKLFGSKTNRHSLASFVVEGAHAHDVGTILDDQGIAVRAGHHCAQPTMRRLGVSATVRASLGLYNTIEDVDHLIKGLGKVREIFS